MRGQILFASIVLFLASCQSNTAIPDDILPRETMKNILVEVNLVEGALKANFILADSAKMVAPTLYEEIYKRHNTDAATFQKSMTWYFEHPEILEEIQKDVVAELLLRER
ncbi:MAG: DUF4296 domain-containing protein [Bacteroidia bacterium]